MVYDLKLPVGCPTKAVNEFEGEAYRVVKTDPPTHSDLLTYLEMNSTPTADPCKRGAISLFAALDQRNTVWIFLLISENTWHLSD